MKKILVIEDEQAVRESILDILNSEDFYAVSAENGQIGIKMVDEFQPHLIICDVMMPEMDGYDVLTQVRQSPKTEMIPFIFLTAKADKNDFRQGMELGADDYLTKPFTHSELLQAISTRLGKQATIEQQSQQKLDELRHSISLSLPHELNTVLNVISGLSALLMEDYDTAAPLEIYELAEAINLNSKRLHRLVQNFLLLAQLEILAASPEKIAALRSNLIDNAVEVVADAASLKALHFDRELDLKLELSATSVQISGPKLKKVVEELVDNAFKFSPEGSPVSVFSSQSEHMFVLHVIDYGRGMTAEQIANVGAYMQFERDFYEQQGAGLGLAIAKRLVELHGGNLIIESIPNQQTIVRASIPMKETSS